MINVNDFKTGVTIKFDDNIYQVLEFQHVKPGKGGAFVRSKLKNLRTKAIIDHTFNAGIKVEAAHIEKTKMQFLYKDGVKYVFMNMDSFEQIELDEELLKEEKGYLKEGLEVDIFFYEKELLGINLPEKVLMKIISCESAVRGNTTNNAMKDALIETGINVKVPLFIEQGEIIVISTKDGKYSSRA